MITNESA